MKAVGSLVRCKISVRLEQTNEDDQDASDAKVASQAVKAVLGAEFGGHELFAMIRMNRNRRR